uniref:Uncharacterized protein n=1 Tax=Megaviridae environmental sample TaxID=1737588 RepID=A0A5J6VJI6_9VIRU|nr:MAG: hypothetical protein [Megaviridae environmental sample]
MKRELLTLGGLFFLFGFIMLCVYDKTIYIPPTIETKMFLLIFGLVAIADIVLNDNVITQSIPEVFFDLKVRFPPTYNAFKVVYPPSEEFTHVIYWGGDVKATSGISLIIEGKTPIYIEQDLDGIPIWYRFVGSNKISQVHFNRFY